MSWPANVVERLRVPDLPEDFGIGCILGPSASGKTAVLQHLFGEPRQCEWPADKAIVSVVAESPSESVARLSSVGLNTIPAWLRPYGLLSNGERQRAFLARTLGSGSVVDDFGTEVNHQAASSMAAGVAKFARRSGMRRVVVATMQPKLVAWLQPDWLLVLGGGRGDGGCTLHLNPGNGPPRVVVQPLIVANVVPGPNQVKLQDKMTDRQLRAGERAAAPPRPLSARHACRRTRELRASVRPDTHTAFASDAMDIEFDGTTRSKLPELPAATSKTLPRAVSDALSDWGLALVVGPSGSGKTTLLAELASRRGGSGGAAAATAGTPAVWRAGEAVDAHFASSAEAAARLRAVRLPQRSWARPWAALSAGERSLCDTARALGNGAVVDEFTSALERGLAARVAASVAALVRARGWRGVVLATCHDDVEAPLAPDWTFDTAGCCVRAYAAAPAAVDGATPAGADGAAPVTADDGDARAADDDADRLALAAAWSFARVELSVTLCEVDGADVWPRFEPHHYLSGELNEAARCFVARLTEVRSPRASFGP